MTSQAKTQLAPGTFTLRSVRSLGAGGLGRVDEVEIIATNCRHPLGGRFARKRLNEQWNAHPIHRERFDREILALQRMKHPSIVSFEGENLAGGERFYLMPLYPESLRDRIVRMNNVASPWPNVATYGAGLADALHYAHLQGFIHRDLKPENILVTATGTPVIADWGLGYFVHKDSKVLQKLTRAGMGTEYYCSLEQWGTGKCGASGDVYSLGIMLAELATGRAVEIGTPGAGIRVDVVQGNSQGARMFNAVIQMMTKTIHTQRYQTMAEVAQALRLTVTYAHAA